MKKAFAISLIALTAWLNSASQEAPYKFECGAAMGMSGYLGDANNSFIFKHPGFTAKVSGAYLPTSRWAFRAEGGITTLSGNTADMSSALPGGAQYAFTSTVYSLHAKAEFNFLPYGIGEQYKRLSRWTPFLSIGAGVSLAASEGSTAAAPSLPIGAGVKYKLSQRLNLIGEFSMTKVFGDKVDGPLLSDLTGIKTRFFKNTDWYSRLTVGIAYELGERCQTCHYID